jgi:hypothetical protein
MQNTDQQEDDERESCVSEYPKWWCFTCVRCIRPVCDLCLNENTTEICMQPLFSRENIKIRNKNKDVRIFYFFLIAGKSMCSGGRITLDRGRGEYGFNEKNASSMLCGMCILDRKGEISRYFARGPARLCRAIGIRTFVIGACLTKASSNRALSPCLRKKESGVVLSGLLYPYSLAPSSSTALARAAGLPLRNGFTWTIDPSSSTTK